jgi:hypothetical protein
MNSPVDEHVNAHRRDGQFQIGDYVLLSTHNLRFPVDTTRAKKLASRWIGPFSVEDRIADGRAYRLDLKSHAHLHHTFHVRLLKRYVHYNQPSRIRRAPMPDLFEDGHEEWDVSAIVSHRWRASHLQDLVSWVGFSEHENSWISEYDSANSITFGHRVLGFSWGFPP